MDLKTLHQQGLSIRELARRSGHSRNTIRNILRSAAPKPFKTPARSSTLDPFKQYLATRFLEHQLSAVRLLAEIQAQGYSGSVYPIRDFIRSLRSQIKVERKLTVRFETPPGKQAQVDWADCGSHLDHAGRRHKVYAFRMILGYSRAEFVQFTTSMELGTFIECHQRAFEYFGGIPQEILYDNLKQVVLSPGKWNPKFLDFAAHYGFQLKKCRPYRARTKGKVERSVRYLRDNFLKGRSFADLIDLNAQSLHWLNYTANVRVHATTGERPCDLLPKELLRPLQEIASYRLPILAVRKVSAESFVHFAGNRYSVPPQYCRKKVIVSQREQRVVIELGDVIVAEHPFTSERGKSIASPDHLSECWKLSVQGNTSPSAESLPDWRLRFDQSVAAPQLSAYEAAA